jgi:HEAT repeat protein
VRAAAASALGRFVLAGELDELDAAIHARIVTDLLTTIHLAGESIETRRRAIESVAYASTVEVDEVLETAYADADPLMRLSAVVGMGRTCSKQWREILLEELDSSSAAMRYEAVLACGGLGLREAVRPLTAMLQDPDFQLRTAAIWSLGQIGGDRAKQVLLAAFEEADDDTHKALEEALAELALGEGDLDLLLYDFDEDQMDLAADDEEDDEWELLWSSTDQEE